MDDAQTSQRFDTLQRRLALQYELQEVA